MHSVCAIIVSFHPDHTLLASLHEIALQVAAIVVVDNGSLPHELSALHQAKNAYPSLEIIELGANKGLAYAQNRGIEWALQHDFSHVLILDQDSLPQENMVQRLIDANQLLIAQGHRVSVVGPQPVDQQSNRPFFFVRYGRFANQGIFCPLDQKNCLLPVDFLIASGSLIAALVLRDVGLMNEAFFIDQVDTEWCLRASALHYQAFAVCDAIMLHSRGDATISICLLGKLWHVPKHSPLRNYYLFRNTVWMFFQKTTHWRWIMINIRRLLTLFIFFGLFVPPRILRLKMMLKGLWDGLLHRH